jgi:hypothetical protein
MAAAPLWRRLRRHFSISAPRMAVRTQHGWPWQLGAAVVFAAVVAGMWWLGFDFGQLLGGFNRREIEGQIATLSADTATAQRESADLRAANSRLESEIAMMRGTLAALEKQQAEILAENGKLKDEVAFLQQFFVDSNKIPGLAIQRLVLDGSGKDVLRYSVLMVRGGAPKDDFEGTLTLQADLVPTELGGADLAPRTLMLPDETTDAAPLRLRFRYYQQLEGTLQVPPGYAVRALTARVYDAKAGWPRASRTLTLP